MSNYVSAYISYFGSAILFVLVVFAIGMLLLCVLDKLFHYKWTCYWLSWHDGKGGTKETTFHDGCSIHSVCAKCGKNVMRDSQGNWF